MLSRIVSVAALSAVAGTVVGAAGVASAAEQEVRELVPLAERLRHEHRPGELLVRFKARPANPGLNRGPDDLAALAADEDGIASAVPPRAIALTDALQMRAVQRISRDGLTVKMETDGDLVAGMAALEASGMVEYAEPNYVYRRTNTPNDEFLGLMWGMVNDGQTIQDVPGRPQADIRADEAWDIWTGDPDYVIAVIDGGIDPSHPDLAANMFVNEAELNGQPGVDDDNNGYVDDIQGWDFWDDDNNPAQDAFHGSHTSGTVAGVGNNGIGVTGVMWQAKVIPLRFIGPSTGDAADAARAVDYAVDMGARISNNSWGGGGFSQTLRDSIDRARQAGHIFVASAGNNGNSDPNLPAAYELPNIVSVANIRNTDQISTLSSRGAPWVDIGAPGTDIVSANGTGGYSYSSGTSMAAPHVAGAMGLLWSYRPELAWDEVIDRTYRRSRTTNAMSAFTTTGGALDAAAMLADVWIASVEGPGRYVSPSEPATIVARLEVEDDALLTDTVVLYYRPIGGGSFTTKLMNAISGDEFSADIPIANCPGEIEFYVTAQSENIGLVSFPVDTDGDLPSFAVADLTPRAAFDFESSAGWTVSGNASDGQWTRGVPVNGGRGDPITDADGSGAAFVTDNSAGNSDVDGGSTVLTSPMLDATGLENPTVSYQRWLVNDIGSNGNLETMVVEISNDGGGTWTILETVDPTSLEASGGWIYKEFSISEFVTPTADLQLRFTVSDDVATVIEGGVDDVRLFGAQCTFEARADLTTGGSNPGDASYGVPDGAVDVADLTFLVEAWVSLSAIADLTTSGSNPGDAGYGVPDATVDVADLSFFVELWLSEAG
ncbi:MAG: S8 family serine peptidase [Planctomycetota bacterium]